MMFTLTSKCFMRKNFLYRVIEYTVRQNYIIHGVTPNLPIAHCIDCTGHCMELHKIKVDKRLLSIPCTIQVTREIFLGIPLVSIPYNKNCNQCSNLTCC